MLSADEIRLGPEKVVSKSVYFGMHDTQKDCFFITETAQGMGGKGAGDDVFSQSA